jgi:hypothetical protein
MLKAALALALLWPMTGHAADLPPGVTCEQVQANYAQWSHLSKTVIRVWLRLNGYSKAQIREAEKCLR